MNINSIEEITTHLEYLGYKIEWEDHDVLKKKDNWYMIGEVDEGSFRYAEHDEKVSFFFFDVPGGVVFNGGMATNEKASTNKTEFIEIINCLNQKSKVTKFYALENNDLSYEAYFFGNYNKSTFNTFIERYDQDTSNIFDEYPTLDKFFGD